MQYMLLIYDDETQWTTMSEEDSGAMMREYFSYTEALKAAGNYVAGDALQPTGTAKSVRVRDGQTQVTDGPAEDLAEPLGGFFLFECESIDEAVQLAAKIPGAETGSVEVWPTRVEGGES
jgi:hypothetical protein